MTLLAAWAAAAGPAVGPGRRGRSAPRPPNRGAARDRGPDRLLRQHPARCALDLSGAPTVARAAGARARRARWARRPTRTCRSSSWWSWCSRRAAWRTARCSRSMFAWQNATGRAPGAAGAAAGRRRMRAPHVTAKFDLTLSLAEDGGRIAGERGVRHRAVRRGHRRALAGLPARALLEAHGRGRRPGASTDLPLLAEAERRQVLREWNATDAAYPARRVRPRAVRGAGRAHAGRGRAGVRGRAADATRELNARANRLAHHLRALGVGAGRAGRRLRWSAALELVVGAARRCSRPAAPTSRSIPATRPSGSRFMLDDARPPSCSRTRRWPPPPPRCRRGPPSVLDLDRRRGVGSAIRRRTRPRPARRPENLAYVIYTSGSTGRPKGVDDASTARVVNRLALDAGPAYGSSAGDGVLQKTPVRLRRRRSGSSSGRCWRARALVMARPGGHRDPAYLAARHPARAGPWHRPLDCVPSHAGSTCSRAGAATRRCLRVRRVSAARRSRRSSAASSPRAAARACSCINLYGPTEAAVDVDRQVDACGRGGIASPSAGRSPNTARLRARRARRAGAGRRGRRAVHRRRGGGARLPGPAAADRGALRPRSLRGEPGARLYRTGDLGAVARRRDARVPRPHRLPGEDPRLPHRARRDRGAARRRTRACARRWCWRGTTAPAGSGWWRTSSGERAGRARRCGRISPSSCRSTWCPRRSCVLDAFPLTPNGKLDRGALPAPDAGAFAARGYVAPARRDGAGARGDLGGGAGGGAGRRARQLLRARRALAAGDAGRLARAAGAGRGGGARATCSSGRRWRTSRAALETARAGAERRRSCPWTATAPLPLSFAQQRLWFLDQLERRGRGVPHRPAPAAAGRAGRERAGARARPRSSRGTRRCAPRFPAVDGEPVAADRPGRGERVPPGWSTTCTAAPRRRRTSCAAWWRRRRSAPFDLARGPLVRGRLVRLAADDHVLLLTMHHIVSDGWSLGVLPRELGALYDAFRARRGRSAPAAAGAVRRLRGVAAALAARARSWRRRRTTGARRWPARRRCWSCPPTARARRGRTSRGASAGRGAGRGADRGAAGRWAQRHGATLFMTLLAGWAAAARPAARARTTSSSARRSPTAARREIEGLIGFFVNTLVLRVDLSGAPSVARAAGAGEGARRWARPRTRTCPSSSWWSRCSRRAAWRTPRCSR